MVHFGIRTSLLKYLLTWQQRKKRKRHVAHNEYATCWRWIGWRY